MTTRHGLLWLTDALPIESVWAANVWLDVELIEIDSIGAAARELRARQRNWSAYAPLHGGRVGLIVEKLPYVSAKPLNLGDAAPTAPLGSFTLIEPRLMLASASCSSAFANGEPRFVEDRLGPPNRAYLKLWEALAVLRRHPGPGDRCIDLGASPGGWTWSLAQLGADVIAIDKAPLDPAVDRLKNVTWRGESAFGVNAADHSVDWLCSDVIAYPNRLIPLIKNWIDAGTARNIVCTIKLQGETDHTAVREAAAIPGSRLVHLHHNKHELTFLWPAR